MALYPWILLLLLTTAAATENASNYSVHNLIQDIQRVEKFQHILVMKHPNDTIPDDFGANFVNYLSAAVDLPVIILCDTTFFLKTTFSSDLLSVVNLVHTTASATLQLLVQNLRQMTVSKIVFLLNYHSNEEDGLQRLFLACARNGLLNAIAVLQDFASTHIFYRYTNIPKFVIEEVQTGPGLPVDVYFPDRLKNMMGHPIRIAYGGSEPKIIFSRTPNGKLLVTGYVGHLLQSILERYNATFFAETITTQISAQELIHMVRNKSADISAGLTYATIPRDGFTYPYEHINWCLMLPVEPSIPIYEVFIIVFRWDTLVITMASIVILSAFLEYSKRRSGRNTNLLSFMINDDCLRGILGQSFIEIRKASLKVKYIYLHIFLLGIILTTSYNSYLQTYLTSPPSQAKIRSFDDLLASGIKTYALRSEYDALIINVPEFGKKYFKMFEFEESFAEYLKFRDTFNTKYAYMVNNVKWVIVKEQQKIFTKPLFRQPERMCFFEAIPMCFPVAENSIYMDMINRLIVDVQDSGLLEYWQRNSFHELIAAKKLKLVDLTSKPEFVPMKAGDLMTIWIGLAGGFTLAMLCFLSEIAVFRWERRRQSKSMILI